jgi:hypothetical protein
MNKELDELDNYGIVYQKAIALAFCYTQTSLMNGARDVGLTPVIQVIIRRMVEL